MKGYSKKKRSPRVSRKKYTRRRENPINKKVKKCDEIDKNQANIQKSVLEDDVSNIYSERKMKLFNEKYTRRRKKPINKKVKKCDEIDKNQEKIQKSVFEDDYSNIYTGPKMKIFNEKQILPEKMFIKFKSKRVVKEISLDETENCSSMKKVVMDMKKIRQFKIFMRMHRDDLIQRCTDHGYEHIYKNGRIFGTKKSFSEYLINFHDFKSTKTGRPKGRKVLIKGPVKLVNMNKTEEVYGLVLRDSLEKWNKLTVWKIFKSFYDYPSIYEKYLLFFFF
jgi:hypothetical protein